MLRDEFETIIEMLDSKMSKSPQALQELLVRVKTFFHQMNQEFQVANQQEKEELLKMLSSLQGKLQDRITQFCNESGISEDQIYHMSQDVSSLPPEQRELVQSTKNEISEASKNIRTHLSKKYTEPKQSASKEELSGEKRKPRVGKSKWTKS